MSRPHGPVEAVVFDRGGKRIGYVRIWSYTRDEVGEILNRELGGGKLANIDGLVLDLRSEAYVELGPAPGSWFVRVVAADPSGHRRALNHFNKKGKGEFVRAVVTAGVVHADVDSLLEWAAESGVALTRGAPGELELLVPEIVAGRARSQ